MARHNDISELIARVAFGDRDAFDALYARTSAKLFGVLLRLLSNRAEAEDALQEVYIKVWQRAAQYRRGVASPMSWLIAIARNHALDRLRARRAPAAPIGEALDVADSAPTPEKQAAQQSDVARIEYCLGQLPSDRAAAVRGAYLEGYSYQDLADRFGVPINTMRTWLRRSLQKLRECIDV